MNVNTMGDRRAKKEEKLTLTTVQFYFPKSNRNCIRPMCSKTCTFFQLVDRRLTFQFLQKRALFYGTEKPPSICCQVVSAFRFFFEYFFLYVEKAFVFLGKNVFCESSTIHAAIIPSTLVVVLPLQRFAYLMVATISQKHMRSDECRFG